MGQADVGGAWGLRLDSKVLIQDTVFDIRLRCPSRFTGCCDKKNQTEVSLESRPT